MRNQFIADVGDFGKYGLLRALCGISPPSDPRLSLNVVWYRNEGKQFDYVEQPKKFADCDPELFQDLKTLVHDDSRTVESIERSGILGPETRFHAQPSTGESDIVFLDPDTGLAFNDKQRSSKAHAILDKAELGSDQTVVIYQSFGRSKHVEQMATWKREVSRLLHEHHEPQILRYRPVFPRAFIIVPSKRHSSWIDDRIEVLLDGPWRRHFKRF